MSLGLINWLQRHRIGVKIGFFHGNTTVSHAIYTPNSIAIDLNCQNSLVGSLYKLSDGTEVGGRMLNVSKLPEPGTDNQVVNYLGDLHCFINGTWKLIDDEGLWE